MRSTEDPTGTDPSPGAARGELRLFLAGDVMTGRGLDRIRPVSVPPVPRDLGVTDARDLIRRAEERVGPIPRDVGPDYVWGDAVDAIESAAPHLRIANLETAVTTHDEPWPEKPVHLRMHPANVDALVSLGLDACVLANNHILDWGRPGLIETMETLAAAGIATAGVGTDAESATLPAVLPREGGGRVLLFSYGSLTAGVPVQWGARRERAGVNLLVETIPAAAAARVVGHVRRHRREGDVVIVSLHWGGNWGYEVPPTRRDLAHRLVDSGEVDLVFGHSPHHPVGVEVYRGRLILYGAGDFVSDYEGRPHSQAFDPEIVLAYFPVLGPDGDMVRLTMTPFRIRRFRLERLDAEATHALADALGRESRALGDTRIRLDGEGRLVVEGG